MKRVFYIAIIALFLPLSCQDGPPRGEQEPGGAMNPVETPPANPAGENSKIPDMAERKSAIARLDRYFTRRNKYNGFNGTVLYAVDGEVQLAEAYGYGDLRKRDSLSIESSFQLASVSKPITALATLILVDQGLINLNDTIQNFFPDFPYKGITVQLLLNHRSGLPNYMYFADSVWPDQNIPISNRDVLNLLTEHHPERYYPPDRRYNYSNTNYALLALIIEEVSDIAYELFVKTKIFIPLDMQNSLVYNKKVTPLNYNQVKGYHSGRRIADNTYLNGVIGDKGIYSSAIDLYKLDVALQNGSLVSLELLDKAFQPQHKDLYQWDNYGLGWRINAADPNNKIVYHSGWWKGFRSYYIRELGTRKTLIVLSNTARTSFLGTSELRSLI
ncbi:MAG: beta-lactamase family protein [Bacteroidetes bacterium]|jgi:CubicO group peptidase (beta-lactamase class C family)|nr:beta-lactamase family protein [Bacteroidota bacterium]MBT4412408.1 beta-lactamase family protein [Bacteroidota bacterium]MBT7466343.1 beta-lactamase family protein [Bacteroidota bacterium]